jgi:flagellar basal body-associated protein FliL
MTKFKRGFMPIELIVVIIILLIVTIGVIYWFSSSIRPTRDTLNSISSSSNSFTVKACNDYCSAMEGKEVEGITMSSDPKYSYCIEKKTFYDDNGKRFQKTCFEVSQIVNSGINPCSC